jgi:hypothetical protein
VGSTVQRYDGLSGQPSQLYTYINPYNPAGGATPALVHPDGSFLTVDNNSIVVISPSSGPSDPPLEQSSSYDDGDCGEFYPRTLTSPASVGQAIIAGDGYAYFPYFYTISSDTNVCTNPEASIGHNETHLRIMKVGTDGFSQEIKVGDWVQDSVAQAPYYITSSTGPAPPGNLLGTLITNANQGVLFSWGGNQLTTVDTSGNPTTATLNSVSGSQSFGVQPVLQRADGTYVGTVVVETNGFPLHSMVTFTLSGQLLWSQPNYVPQIATSGGGVIATSLDGSTTATFDANGNQTGKLASLPTRSWTGGAYKLGSVESFYTLLAALEAGSYYAVAGGNPSGTSAAVQEAPYPQLASCYDETLKPPPPCPGPREVIWNAYQGLVAHLRNNIPQVQANVFNLLKDSSGNAYQATDFINYLAKGFSPYDGTQSTAPLGLIECPRSSAPVLWLENLLGPYVKSNFRLLNGQVDPAAGASTEAGVPPQTLTTFFNPGYFDYLSYPELHGANPFNMAVVFHEGLHGFTGQCDQALQTAFSCTVSTNTQNITDYVEEFLYPKLPGYIKSCTQLQQGQ